MYTPIQRDPQAAIDRPPLWSVISIPMVFYMSLIHVLGALALWPICSPSSWESATGVAPVKSATLWFAFALWPITAMGNLEKKK